MKPATSSIVKQEHQKDTCIYCGGKLSKEWESTIENGLERKIKRCENGHIIRKKTRKNLTIMQFAKVHLLDL